MIGMSDLHLQYAHIHVTLFCNNAHSLLLVVHTMMLVFLSTVSLAYWPGCLAIFLLPDMCCMMLYVCSSHLVVLASLLLAGCGKTNVCLVLCALCSLQLAIHSHLVATMLLG